MASALLQDETSPEDITAATVITPQEVKDIRARLGMTYRQLAIALGLTGRRALNTVYRWERGLKVPSPASIEGLRQLRANMKDRPDVRQQAAYHAVPPQPRDCLPAYIEGAGLAEDPKGRYSAPPARGRAGR